MELIRTRAFTLKIHWTGIIACVVLSLLGYWMETLAALCALLSHEIAHIAVAALLKLPIRCVELTPFGGLAKAVGYQGASVAERVAVALAGVIGSLLVFALTRLIQTPFARLYAQMSLCMAVFNLLPVLPLDGGRAIFALCEALPHAPKIRKCMYVSATILGGSMLLLAFYGAWNGVWNPSLIISGPYLCYAARQDERTQGMLAVERNLRFRDTLRKRGSMPVTAYACLPDMPREERLQQWLRMRENRYRLLLEVDPETGVLRRVLDEKTVMEELLGDETLHNHHKSV